MKEVLIIGPSPDRIGGVSTHISRLTSLLSNQYEFDYIDEGRGKRREYYNLRKGNIFTYFKKIRNADIVHIHSGVFLLRFLHILFSRLLFRKYVVVSIHHDLAVEGHVSLTRSLLAKCNCAILDSNSIYDSVIQQGVRCSYEIMPAFLPPLEDKEEELPDNVKKWIIRVKQAPESVLMCSSSYSIGDYNGYDLYGNDMSIEAIRELNGKMTGKSFYLLMIVHNSENNPEKLKYYENKISEVGDGRILLLTSPVSFINVMKESDVVLRPTNTDGDSITIREALFFSKAIVASDCAKRPEGTFVFKTRDMDDFCNKILMAVQGNQNNSIKDVDYQSFYIRCYENDSSSRK